MDTARPKVLFNVGEGDIRAIIGFRQDGGGAAQSIGSVARGWALEGR
jgi:hypothetical protein